LLPVTAAASIPVATCKLLVNAPLLLLLQLVEELFNACLSILVSTHFRQQ